MNPRHLRWATHKENCARRTAHGTQLIGEKHNLAKLTEGQVWDIRHAAPTRGTGRELARYYGVSPATISLIRNGKNWKHIK
jgi:transcriptional regulator with XRE-family HTH domain